MAMAVGVGTPPTIAPLQAVTSSTQRACAIRPSSSSNTLSSLVNSEELCVRRRNARPTWSPLKVRSIAAGPPKSPGTTGAAASHLASQQQQKAISLLPSLSSLYGNSLQGTYILGSFFFVGVW